MSTPYLAETQIATDIVQRSIDTIRTLSIDAVQAHEKLTSEGIRVHASSLCLPGTYSRSSRDNTGGPFYSLTAEKSVWKPSALRRRSRNFNASSVSNPTRWCFSPRKCWAGGEPWVSLSPNVK